MNYYKIEGKKVSQIIDGWLFVTYVPDNVQIIIKEKVDIKDGDNND